MVKSLRTRIISIILSMLILISAVPITTAVTASAEEVFDVDGVTLGSFLGNVNSKVTGENSLCVSGTGVMNLSTYLRGVGSVTLTVDNSEGESDRVLSFFYSAVFESAPEPGTAVLQQVDNKGKAVDGGVRVDVTSAGVFTHLVPAGSVFYLSISVTTAIGPFTDTMDITDIRLVDADDSVSVTVVNPYFSLYTGVDDDLCGKITSSSTTGDYDLEGEDPDYTYTDLQPGVDTVTLTAVPYTVDPNTDEPKDYEFVAFVAVDDSFEITHIVSYDSVFTYSPGYDGIMISAIFAPASETSGSADAVFKIGNYYAATLDDAITYTRFSQSKIIELNKSSYTLPAGTYTVPSGVTLMIPFDDDHTLYTSMPALTKNTPGTNSTDQRYSLLTLAPGADLIMDTGSVLSVSSKHPASSQSAAYNGATSGNYAQIDLSAGSSITLNDGAILYAWGYITGDGEINSLSGASTYEFMQIYDSRGGTAMLGMASSASNNQFFFNQYYVQNIEAKLIINYGATEYVYMNIGYGSGSDSISMATGFIGATGAFVLDAPGSRMEKKYDPVHDVMKYDMYGTAKLSTISIAFQGVGLSTDNWYLPINDIDITIHADAVLNTSKMVIFLPGSSIEVEDGASINLYSETFDYEDPVTGEISPKTSNGSVVLASKEDPIIQKYSAGDSKPFRPATFSPTRTGTRTWDTMNNASLVNNGTVTISDDASLATTTGTVSVTGDGTFIIDGPNVSPALSRAQGTTITILPGNLQTEPVDLTNDDGVSEVSMGVVWAQDNAEFRKINGVWGDWRTVRVYNEDKTVLLASTDELMTRDQFESWLASEGVPAPSKEATLTYTYEFSGWLVASSTTTSVTLYPSFTAVPRTFIYRFFDIDGTFIKDVEVPYDSRPAAEDIPVLQQDPTPEHSYYFRWHSEVTGQDYTNGGIPKVTGSNPLPVYEYYAVRFEEDRSYTIQWYNHRDGYIGYDTVLYSVSPSKQWTPSSSSNLYGWQNRDTGIIYHTAAGETLPLAKDTGDTSYKALITYNITWMADSTNQIAVTQVFYNAHPTPPLTATVNGVEMLVTGWKYKSGSKTYTFNAGDELPAVNATRTYTATGFEPLPDPITLQHSLNLEGAIGVNFYFSLPDGAALDDYSVKFEFRGEECTAPSLSEITAENTPVYSADGKTSVKLKDSKYAATLYVDLPELTDAITASLYCGDELIATDEFKAAEYGTSLFNLDHTVTAGEFYLVGTIGGEDCWAENVKPMYHFIPNPNASSGVTEYMLEHVQLHDGDRIKAIKYQGGANNSHIWYTDGTNNECWVNSDGTYNIYLRPDGNGGDDWYYHVLYLSKDSAADDKTSLYDVTRALLRLGAAAQTYFNHNTSDLADTQGEFIDNSADFGDVTAEMINARIHGYNSRPADDANVFAEAGLKYYGTSVVLNDKTKLKIYFTIENYSLFTANKSNFTLSVNGSTAADISEDDMTVIQNRVVCFEIPGVPAAELDDSYCISLGDAHYYYSALDYARKALASDNPALRALGKALYWYSVKADAYFG